MWIRIRILPWSVWLFMAYTTGASPRARTILELARS